MTIFPDPVRVEERPGVLSVDPELVPSLRDLSSEFARYSAALAPFKIRLSIASNKAPLEDLGSEGYRLVISSEGVTVAANTEAGCFYGIQTLRWILASNGGLETHPNKSLSIPCCEITDYPRFSYRGYMLDEARYFLGIEAVKTVLDWMALLKLNRFHWHLTEDQGWRVEIKKYPKLTEIGSRRASTPVYRNTLPPEGQENSDGIPHGGFYTQDEIREIVDYAAKRHIIVIPEIEMPGHATAALASYPEFRCLLPEDLPPEGANIFGQHLDGPDIKVSTKWGVHANIFCAGNPKTIEFLHDVLEEVVELFPGPIIHIGGDEVPKAQWMCCERCQEKLSELGLDAEEKLQGILTAEIIDFLAGLGKQTMLWNEHTDESLSRRKQHVICQYWTGALGRIAGFLEQGGRVVMSPSRSIYVDLSYLTLPLKKVYAYDPLRPETLSSISESAAQNARAGGIIGVEAPMWGEVFQSLKQVEYCTFPRLFAITDLAWTPYEKRDDEGFIDRLTVALAFWDALQIHHATLEEADPSDSTIEEAKKDPKFGTYMHF